MAEDTPSPTGTEAITEKIVTGDVNVKGSHRNKRRQKTAESDKSRGKKAESKPTFPAEHQINAYGFLGMRKAWLEAMGWTKQMGITLSLTEDGKGLIIRKKE